MEVISTLHIKTKLFTCLRFNQGFYKKTEQIKSDIHSSITSLIQKLLKRTTFA